GAAAGSTASASKTAAPGATIEFLGMGETSAGRSSSPGQGIARRRRKRAVFSGTCYICSPGSATRMGHTGPRNGRGREGNGDANTLAPTDRPAHDWYRFVLSFPPHLVRQYLEAFGTDCRHRVLDPFCGTGTTVVECKKQGIASVGVEANPMAHFASRVKVDWSPDPDGLVGHAAALARAAGANLEEAGIEDEGGPDGEG